MLERRVEEEAPGSAPAEGVGDDEPAQVRPAATRGSPSMAMEPSTRPLREAVQNAPGGSRERKAASSVATLASKKSPKPHSRA